MPRSSRGSRGVLIALALALVLAACSGQSQVDEGPQAEAPPTEAPPTEAPSAGGSGQQGASAGGGADEESSESEVLDGPWRDVDLDDVPVEREIHPDEYVDVMVACVREQGFPAEPNRGGGVSFQGASEEQAPLVAQVTAWCSARFPLMERYTQPLDDDQIRMHYRYLVEEAVPCIHEQGYQTPEPPSEDTYVANYGDFEAPQWIPFPSPGGIPQDDWHDLIEACPQSLPIDDFFPED